MHVCLKNRNYVEKKVQVNLMFCSDENKIKIIQEFINLHLYT